MGLLFQLPAPGEDDAWRIGWPVLQGPYGNLQGPPTTSAIVDDLTDARLVWESEEKDYVLCASGRNPDQAKMKLVDPDEGKVLEPPIVAGRIYLRTETGTVVCYDLGRSR